MVLFEKFHGQVPWETAMQDGKLLFYLSDVCYNHLGPIGTNNGTHAKHLTDKVSARPDFRSYCINLYAISRLTNIHVAKMAQSRLVDVIRDLPDEAGADWFEDNWTGEQKGRWCKAHAGPCRWPRQQQSG